MKLTEYPKEEKCLDMLINFFRGRIYYILCELDVTDLWMLDEGEFSKALGGSLKELSYFSRELSKLKYE